MLSQSGASWASDVSCNTIPAKRARSTRAANFSSGVTCLDSIMSRRRSSCCSTRPMATFMTRAAETEVLRGEEIGHDRSTPEGERFYSLRRSLI
jgi:hypothetical protein